MSQQSLWVPDGPMWDGFDFEVELEWHPQVKERPRCSKHSPKPYTPKKTLDAERQLAEQWDRPPLDGPLAVGLDLFNDHITVRFAPCVDYTNRSLRGDLDNYQKLVWDALNGVAYADDRQIVAIQARKM